MSKLQGISLKEETVKAARVGDLTKLKKLLPKIHHRKYKEDILIDAAILAAVYGSVNTLECLMDQLDTGEREYYLQDYEDHILRHAVINRQVDVVKFLIKRGVDVSRGNGWCLKIIQGSGGTLETLLILASKKDSLSKVLLKGILNSNQDLSENQ